MKNTACFILAVIAALCILVVYYIGNINGINYALTASRIYTDSNNIYIELDNNLYIHKR